MPARKKSGFTLIELLVVIAIIAILAAILFPVFARAREAARKSTCQNNMKECAIALHTYWNDFDSTLPSSMNVPGSTATWSGGNFDIFSTRIGVVPIPATATAQVPCTWCMMLYNSMKSKDIMFCPSDSRNGDHTAENVGTAPNQFSKPISYYWKCAIDKAWFGPISPDNGKCQKEGDFGYNADQIVFYEAAGYHGGKSQGFGNDVQINVAFLDTHVRNVTLVNSCASGTYQSDAKYAGEPCFFNFDNDNSKQDGVNPPNAATATSFLDPRRYSDMLP